jgi:hypothetical protein
MKAVAMPEPREHPVLMNSAWEEHGTVVSLVRVSDIKQS